MIYLLLVLALQAYGLVTDQYKAPLYADGHPRLVPDSYIINFKQYHTLDAHWTTIGRNLSDTPDFLHYNMFWSYATTMDRETLELVRSDPNVDSVETHHYLDVRPLPTANRTDSQRDGQHKKRRPYQSIVGKAPYHLAMIGAAGKLNTPVVDYAEDYEYLYKAGEGVNIYIMDSGVRITHSQFDTRASYMGGVKQTDQAPYCPQGETQEDIDGHGTHVAATAAGNTLGVAPYANIRSVKVLCQGADPDNKLLIKAFNDISEEHNDNRAGGYGWLFRGSVINMSFGGYSSWGFGGGIYSVGQAIGWARWYGINLVGAAGNDNKNTATDWPCYWSSVMCVGGVDQNYAKASFSNHGSQINYIAPALDILSASYKSDTGTAYEDGNSMASPQVAGIAAIFVSWKGLATGGADGYVSSNSLDGLSSGWPWFSSSTQQWLANTGIRSPKKYPNEPFRWAGDYPAANIQSGDAVPIEDSNVVVISTSSDGPVLAPTYTPAFVDVPGDTAHYTQDGTVTVNNAAPTDSPQNVGLDTKYDNLNPTDTDANDPQGDVPTNVLQGLGVTDLAKPSDTLATVSGTASGTVASTPPPAPSGNQQVAWASYVNPLADPDAWNRFVSYESDKFTILVANIINGPDIVVNQPWQDVINRAAASGKTVLGYVRTGYFGLSQQQFQTRLGSTALNSWVAQIEQDVELWYSLYTNIGGIFFDEGWPECGDNNIYSDTYAWINANTKRRHPGAYTVLNPGSPMAQCYENTMDTLLTFESSYEQYTSNFVPNTWTPQDPRKIWHIIYNVAEANVAQVASLARDRGAGLIHITAGVMPNPYGTLDPDDYINTILSSITGGTPSAAGPVGWPNAADASVAGSLSVVSSEYTSVTLQWSGTAAGFRVYADGKSIMDLPGTMTSIVVGMLQAGSTHSFTVVGLDGGGVESTQLGSVSASTTPFPGGQPIINISAGNQNGQIYVQADILAPFAFQRLFLCQPWDGTNFQPTKGWGVQWSPTYPVYATWLVEGVNSYKYDPNAQPDANGNWPWDWLPVDPATKTVNGYTSRWSYPDNGLGIEFFVIQTQGYAPLTQIFSTCVDLQGAPSTNTFCIQH